MRKLGLLALVLFYLQQPAECTREQPDDHVLDPVRGELDKPRMCGGVKYTFKSFSAVLIASADGLAGIHVAALLTGSRWIG